MRSICCGYCSAKALETMVPAWSAPLARRSVPLLLLSGGCCVVRLRSHRCLHLQGAICPGGFRLWPMPGYWNEGDVRIPCKPNPREHVIDQFLLVKEHFAPPDVLCHPQGDTRVVPCDPPAEERCRGVNNTNAAPRIIDACPDPLDRGSCYATLGENGCGQSYYAGLSQFLLHRFFAACCRLLTRS